MGKLKLDLDEVVVESFPTDARRQKGPGTAQANVTAGSRTCLVPFC